MRWHTFNGATPRVEGVVVERAAPDDRRGAGERHGVSPPVHAVGERRVAVVGRDPLQHRAAVAQHLEAVVHAGGEQEILAPMQSQATGVRPFPLPAKGGRREMRPPLSKQKKKSGGRWGHFPP
jgi:hypothetical protein